MSLFNKFLIVIKLFFLYLLYWFVGLTPEDFYIRKATYLSDLNFNHSAIKYLEKALSDSKNPFIYALLGYCYLQEDKNELAVENYKIAYNKLKNASMKIGLAVAEFHNNNRDESLRLYSELINYQDKLTELDKHNFERLKELLGL